MDKGDIIKAPCNSCGGTTKHTILAARTTHEFDRDENDPDAFPVETNRYAMLECCGCESISLQGDESWRLLLHVAPWARSAERFLMEADSAEVTLYVGQDWY